MTIESAGPASCPLCDTVEQAVREKPLNLIYAFENSILLIGEHQFFPGYCVLVSKLHAREMHDLPESVQTALFQELMIASRAIADEFRPRKLNLASLGNVVPHVHWHIFPRYDSDPDHLSHPWLHSQEFAKFRPTAESIGEIARRIRARLA